MSNTRLEWVNNIMDLHMSSLVPENQKDLDVCFMR